MTKFAKCLQTSPNDPTVVLGKTIRSLGFCQCKTVLLGRNSLLGDCCTLIWTAICAYESIVTERTDAEVSRSNHDFIPSKVWVILLKVGISFIHPSQISHCICEGQAGRKVYHLIFSCILSLQVSFEFTGLMAQNMASMM